MSDRLDLETFAPRVGETFRLEAAESVALDVTLSEAAETRSERTSEGDRRPFALVFKGPQDPVLPQRIYRLRHEEIGTIDVFLVPVARDVEGTSYEAVFN